MPRADWLQTLEEIRKRCKCLKITAVDGGWECYEKHRTVTGFLVEQKVYATLPDLVKAKMAILTEPEPAVELGLDYNRKRLCVGDSVLVRVAPGRDGVIKRTLAGAKEGVAIFADAEDDAPYHLSDLRLFIPKRN